MKRIFRFYNEHGLKGIFDVITANPQEVVRFLYPFRYQFPYGITVEIMTVCNLKCAHCYQRYIPHNPVSNSFMNFALFQKIVEKLSPMLQKVTEFNFASVEALLHEKIFDMIRLVRTYSPAIRIPIYTNGLILDNNRIGKLLELDINSFVVSLDGCRRDTVQSFKTGTDFDRVVNNIISLKRLGNSRISLATNFVAHSGNIGELSEYVDFCHNLGVDKIHVSGFIPYSIEHIEKCLYSEEGMDHIEIIFKRSQEKAQKLGMQLTYRGTKLNPGVCVVAPRILYVDGNGNVVPCLQMGKRAPLILFNRVEMSGPVIWGNTLEQNPYRIWTGKESVNFRKKFFNHQLPKNCLCCPMGYDVIC